MAKAKMATEEAQAKKAEEMSIAARVNEEKVKRQAELERLMPLSETQDGRVSVPAGDSGGTDGGLIVHLEDARSATSLPSDETDSDASSDGDPFDDDDNCVEADFTVIEDDEYTGFNRSKHERSKSPTVEQTPFRGMCPKTASATRAAAHGERLAAQSRPPARSGSAGLTTHANTSSDAAEELTPNWASHMQLITFRETACKIADDYLKEAGITLNP